jgi:UDP-N-acetylmuramoyl-L-alanyl-D-glutamate--2,6-diaminopimelate ligase
MKQLIKKLIRYDMRYDIFKDSIVYELYKKWYAQLANNIYGAPSQTMFVIGITGTDGKTTTANILHHLIQSNLGDCCMISTALIKIGTHTQDNITKMSSLDPMQLQKLLSTAKSHGCRYAIIETTSHWLDQHRFDGIEFDMAVLTNITAEHLDYHKTFDKYIEAKKKLFKSIVSNTKTHKYAVLPKDDETGRKWLTEFSFDKQIDYSQTISSSLKADNVQMSIDGLYCDINYLWQSFALHSSLIGRFNIYNILAALGWAILMGISPEQAIKSVQTFVNVPGRMQYFNHEGVHYFVDFAHTPWGMQSVLDTVNTIKGTGRIILVCGATGNRDTYKRPQMAQIWLMHSDLMILTDDDPDTEDRYRIVWEMAQGVENEESDWYLIIPQREYAIQCAIRNAKPWDIVVCTGKWHEQMQLTNRGRRTRSDIHTLQKLLGIRSN